MKRKIAALAAVVALVGAVPVAHGQDANGIYGNVYGCTVQSFGAASWTQIASADMKDTSTGAALTAGLFLSSLSLVSREAYGGTAAFIGKVGADTLCLRRKALAVERLAAALAVEIARHDRVEPRALQQFHHGVGGWQQGERPLPRDIDDIGRAEHARGTRREVHHLAAGRGGRGW